MSQWLNRFPFEIRAAILGQLSLRNLASVSLVCREWQLSAFPSLYHTVYICKLTHLEVLAQRMLVENVQDMLSVPMYLRCLRLGGSGRWLGSNNLHYLDAIVPRLIHLNCLYWELGFMPINLDCFSKCPALKSVHLVPNVFSIHPVDNWIRRLPQ
ncbi:unnamed protein product [Rhizoctonia solani]|uniref:F-box domain-containing protein n=1 Tax=Rhizoctonia solani TaxID=456999 RepID=A0A8H3C544_9AGAM|nr:unnamed protein product [Rhizoctonia solani]